MVGCAVKQPVLVYESPSLGDGGRLLRDLYRSFWLPPGSDDEIVRIGLQPEVAKVTFRTRHAMRIRAMSEHASWEVASPPDVVWEVRPLAVTRPAHVRYYATLESRLKSTTDRLPKELPRLWKRRGFPSSRWIGPPSMDTEIKPHLFERWFLSITAPTSEVIAKNACAKVRRAWKISCKVIARAELPQVGRGLLQAVNGNFSKEFDGLLELISPRGPIEILDLIPEEIRDESSNELFGPRLFVVPLTKKALSLVQSTSFGNYLEGVVPAETFPNGPEHALKAQAIIARTYALRNAHTEFSFRPFLLCASTQCQVYRGVEFKQPATSRAVQQTANLVLRDQQGELAETFYHSICGGHTEARSTIWGGKNRHYQKGVSDQLPNAPFVSPQNTAQVSRYLTSPPTSYCGISRLTNPERWRWEKSLDRSDLKRILSKTGLRGPLQSLRVTKRGISGRALALEVRAENRQKIIRGEYRIRLLLGGLLSSLFTLQPEFEGGELVHLLIRGGGYGHGVGLCQMGAIGRAEMGQSFSEILEAYYPGTVISPITQLKVH